MLSSVNLPGGVQVVILKPFGFALMVVGLYAF